MTAPLRNVDGTVAAPALAFTAEPASGLYRAAANDVRLAVGGADALKLVAGGVAELDLPTAASGLVKATAAGAQLQLQGNRNAADVTTDVAIAATAARTTGTILTIYNGPQTAFVPVLSVDYLGLVRLLAPAAAIQPASIWTTATLAAGWTGSVSYFKDACGVVHLKGGVTNNSGGLSSATILTLPVGFRVPATGRLFSCSVGSGTPVGVIVSQLGDGAVAPSTTIANGGSVYLDSISFLAES